MKRSHSHLVTLLPLLSNIVALHTLFVFFSYARSPLSDLGGLLIWWGCITLTYGVLAWFLRRPRSLQQLILIAAGGFLLQLVLTLLFSHRHSTFLAWAVLLFFWVCMYGRCCMLLLDGIKPESVTAAFETTVLMLFVAAFAVTLSVMMPENLLCTAVGVLFSLIAMARVRSGHARVDTETRSSAKGHVFLALILVALGGGTALLCVLLAGTASQLLSRMTQWCFSVLRATIHVIGRFFRWLGALLPEKEIDPALLADPDMQFPIGEAKWGTMDSNLFLYLGTIVLAVFLLAILIWLWKTGGFRQVSFRSRTVGRAVRKRPDLRALLARLLHHFFRWGSFQIAYLQQRNTVPGLFVWLEKQMRAQHLPRQINESPRAFLQRAQKRFPESAAILTQLSDCLDQHYFGGNTLLSSAEIISMRKYLNQIIHSKHLVSTIKGGTSDAT